MRLLLILRNPTDRAYSSYIHWVRGKNYTESFENFLSDYKPALQYGFYSRYLKNYLSIFKREQILILIFERAVNNIPGTKTKLADFLGLSAEEFPEQSGFERANRGYIPKFKFAYGIVNRITDLIRYKWKQDAIVDWYLDLARRLRIKRLFGDVGTLSKMKEETRKYLDDLYNDEIRQLESLFEVDLSCWKHK
jgi:hypothetical protein